MEKSHVFGTLAVLVFIVFLVAFSGSDNGITGNAVSDVTSSPGSFIGVVVLVAIMALFVTGKDWFNKEKKQDIK